MDDTKWEAILAEAAEAFGRFGFRKTSMDQIARAAGVAKGTLYLGCTNKRDLFYQVILRDLRLWNGQLAKRIDPRVTAEELLLRVSQEALQSRDQYPLALGLIMGEYDQDLPDWAERLEELRGSGLTTLLEILRLGVRQKRFRSDLDLEQVAGILLDLLTSMMMFHARGPQAEERLALRAVVTFELILKGLRPRSPTPAHT